MAGMSGQKTLVQLGGANEGFGDVPADLARVYVEGRHDLDVARGVAAELPVHEPDGVMRALASIEMDALDEGAGAVAHADHRDSDVVHQPSDSVCEAPPAPIARRPRGCKPAHIPVNTGIPMKKQRGPSRSPLPRA